MQKCTNFENKIHENFEWVGYRITMSLLFNFYASPKKKFSLTSQHCQFKPRAKMEAFMNHKTKL